MPVYKNKGIFEFAKKWLIDFNNRVNSFNLNSRTLNKSLLQALKSCEFFIHDLFINKKEAARNKQPLGDLCESIND